MFCLLERGEELFSSTKSGIRPLIEIIDSGLDVQNAVAYDKIVGKAVAILYCIMKVCAVHEQAMTKSALELLQAHGIQADCQLLTEKIINRQGTDICPMEKVVINAEDPHTAYKNIKEKLQG